MSHAGARQPASGVDNSGKEYVCCHGQNSYFNVFVLVPGAVPPGACKCMWQQLVNSCPWICSKLYGGLSWGAGALILGAAGWAVLQNAGYSALLKVMAGSVLRINGPVLSLALINLFEAAAGLGGQLCSWEIGLPCRLCADFPVRDRRQDVFHCWLACHEGMLPDGHVKEVWGS